MESESELSGGEEWIKETDYGEEESDSNFENNDASEIPVIDLGSTDDEKPPTEQSSFANDENDSEGVGVDSEWERELEKHMDVSSVGSVKAFACTHPGCPKFFSKVSRLKTHLLSHTGERPFVCEYEGCDASYTRKVHLTRHIQSNHESQSFSCDKCSSVFKSSLSLSRHLRTAHENANRYGCEECKKTFPKKSFLKKHVCGEKKSEEVEKVKRCHVCDLCGLKFRFPNKLKIHLATHTAKKCHKCNETFLSAQELRKHVAKEHKHHKNVCPHCDKVFSRPYFLRQHLTTAHEETIQMFNCPYEGCDSKYTLERNLNQHIKVHHSPEGQDFVCPECGKTLNHKRSYERHLQLHKEKGSKIYQKVKKPPKPRKDRGQSKKSMLSILTSKELTMSENKSLMSGKVVPIEATEIEKQIRSNPDLENELVDGFDTQEEEELTGDVCARQSEMYEEIFLPKMLKKIAEEKRKMEECPG